jgi:hypothetical protein
MAINRTVLHMAGVYILPAGYFADCDKQDPLLTFIVRIPLDRLRYPAGTRFHGCSKVGPSTRFWVVGTAGSAWR